jgi:hypothetical protein
LVCLFVNPFKIKQAKLLKKKKKKKKIDRIFLKSVWHDCECVSHPLPIFAASSLLLLFLFCLVACSSLFGAAVVFPPETIERRSGSVFGAESGSGERPG